MRFTVFDNLFKRDIRKPGDYFVNGYGELFIDCDPNGVDMSGKRRIFGADTKRFVIKEEKILQSASPTNNASKTLPTFEAFEFFMKVNKDLSNKDIYEYLTGNDLA